MNRIIWMKALSGNLPKGEVLADTGYGMYMGHLTEDVSGVFCENRDRIEGPVSHYITTEELESIERE